MNFVRGRVLKVCNISLVTSRSVTAIEKFSNVQFKKKFSPTPIGISKKTSHSLLAFYPLSDLVQFVWRSAVTRGLVIQ